VWYGDQATVGFPAKHPVFTFHFKFDRRAPERSAIVFVVLYAFLFGPQFVFVFFGGRSVLVFSRFGFFSLQEVATFTADRRELPASRQSASDIGVGCDRVVIDPAGTLARPRDNHGYAGRVFPPAYVVGLMPISG